MKTRLSAILVVVLHYAFCLPMAGLAGEATTDEKAALRRAINDLSASFPGRYSRGGEFLARLDAVKNETEFKSLQHDALMSNPLLDFDKLLVVRRDAKNLGLPQNWVGNCGLPHKPYDNEIAILTLSNTLLTSFFKPTNSVFVGDVDLNFDADKMLFSMPEDSGRWHVWQLNADGTGLRRLTPVEPKVDQYDACYLPDGRIIFNSTAAVAGVPCVGGSAKVANLFRMDADGSNIRRLCFDQEHNWCPTVLNDGRVLYTRWEYTDTPHYFTRLLFTMNPDGTAQSACYGSNSYWPNSTFFTRPIPGHPTKLVTIVSGHHGAPRMGELLVFDPALGREEAAGAVQRIPGYGQPVKPVIADQLVANSWPKFLHPYPLSEKYFLVSCQPSPHSSWGIWLVDIFDNMVPICEQPGQALFEPIPFRATPRPPVIPDRVHLEDKEATVYLTDIYAGPGLAGVPRGTVKKLRVYSYHFAYPGMGGHINIGIDGPWDVHRILGTVPVNKDGSAVFKVPANTPLAVQPLDAEGQAIQVMRSWFTAMPGENVSCAGCHEKQNSGPGSKSVMMSRQTPSAITPWYGPARGFSFKREVQPVLDKYCVGCHATFAGDLPKAGGFDASYVALHPFVRRPGPESDYHLPKPYEYHASTSELVQLLRQGHHGVRLDSEAWDRLITWIDLNVPDHGTWGEHRPIPNGGDVFRHEMLKKYAGMEDDPESHPPAPAPVKFVAPSSTDTRREKSRDWTFDTTRVAQMPKTLSFELGGGQSLDLVLVPGRKPFYLGKFEVMNTQYRLFDPTHDSGYIQIFNKDRTSRGVPVNADRQPVVRVSWREATAFCQWLSQKTGRVFKLPDDAQWEWACRAGAGTPMWYGNTNDHFCRFANLADVELRRLLVGNSPPWLPVMADMDDRATVTAPVGSYQPNAWGLYDMHGNAAEWTASEKDGRKLCCGGSFYDRPYRATASARVMYEPWQPVFDVGFRVMSEATRDEIKRK